MFYIVCPYCHIGIEISGTKAGPDCREVADVGHCSACGESFFFDKRDVVEERQPEATL
jgi:RecJ-like exonuclease